ncbi:fungal-specific transcription factor domain-containing protein [Mycena leptocephala]|nr:fungal-specific transcription factor domain-containing protein [Mycena leptocephala]
MSWPVGTPAYTLPFTEYDDDDDHEPDTPGGGGAKEKAVRRRSSKACDQCRKSKCKCERPGPGEPCRSCVVLGTECTSLGPSRKRGPPKGYIDAIEARLHQTEALVGILLAAAGASSSSQSSHAKVEYTIDEEDEEGRGGRKEGREVDERARGLLADLREDPLARAILARIDQSAYGPAGRAAAGTAAASSSPQLKSHPSSSSLKSPGSGHGSGQGSPAGGNGVVKGEVGAPAMIGSTHPSHEWMDRVTTHILSRASEAQSSNSNNSQVNQSRGNNFGSPVHPHAPQSQPHGLPQLHPHAPQPQSHQRTRLAHSRSFEQRSPARSGASTPNRMYAFGQQQQHTQPQLHSHTSQSQLGAGHGHGHGQAPPQRPAIITALPPQGYHSLSAGGAGIDVSGGGSAVSGGQPIPLSASSDGRRLRRRVDGGRIRARIETAPRIEMGARIETRRGRTGHAGANSNAFFGASNGTPSRQGRSRSYSPAGSGSEAELDVDVPHHPHPSPPRRVGRYDSDGRGSGEGREGRGGRGRDTGAEGLAGAVGQLSLNEDKQVRYHGKASGLHLLARRAEPEGERSRGRTQVRRGPSTSAPRKGDAGAGGNVIGSDTGEEGEDEEVGRNVGGIWRFPKARVWPEAPAAAPDDDYGPGAGVMDADGLPPRGVQEALLTRYFAHVHPSFPVVHKRAVLEAWGRREGPPPLLLLAMYALAARHAPQPASCSISEAPSQYITCQALLLMGFREIGIGAMAQAWIYIGMAVRMAQDLGMQRDADGWVRAGVRVGHKNASQGKEKGKSASRDAAGDEERMIEDKSQPGGREGGEVGRSEDGKLFGPWEIAERRRIWYACVIMDKYVSTYIGAPTLAIFERDFDTSLPSESDAEEMEDWAPPADAPACGSRHAELVVLDGQLEKWHLALPAHLQHDPRAVPLPQVLTLHMQYWCAVLLLHRPFIRQNAVRNKHSPAPEDGEVRGNAEKSYELCAGAANHITTIVSSYPTDPQARLGLTKCMDALREMEIVWPAAGRALELLLGAQATLADAETDVSSSGKLPRATPIPTGLLFEWTLPLDARNNSATMYYPPPASPYERWPTEDGALAFPAALSTAVMGPTYSTGFVDERRPPAHEGEPRYGQQQQPPPPPQYWNDYTAFQPLGPGYGELHDPALTFGMYTQNHHGP